MSWHVTVGVRLYGRRAAAVPFPKLAWETILGRALACASLHTRTEPPCSSTGRGRWVLQDPQEREGGRSKPVSNWSVHPSAGGCPWDGHAAVASLWHDRRRAAGARRWALLLLPLREPVRRPANGQEVRTGAARSAAALPSTSERPNPSPRLPLPGLLTPSENS